MLSKAWIRQTLRGPVWAFGAIEEIFGHDVHALVLALSRVDLSEVEEVRLRGQLRDALVSFQHLAQAEALK